MAYPLRRLGYLALLQNDVARAQALQTESLGLNLDQKEKRGIAHNLPAFAAIATAKGQAARAAQLFGATEALLESIGVRLTVADQIECDRYVEIARAQLDKATFDQAWHAGRSLSVVQTLDLALERKL